MAAAAGSNWKVFGPRSSHSDGDAEFYRVSNRLAQQYEWFAPGSEEEAAAAEAAELQQQQRQQLLVEQDHRKPLYGLTPQQIQALGLSGPRVNTPDPVRVGGALETQPATNSQAGGGCGGVGWACCSAVCSAWLCA